LCWAIGGVFVEINKLIKYDIFKYNLLYCSVEFDTFFYFGVQTDRVMRFINDTINCFLETIYEDNFIYWLYHLTDIFVNNYVFGGNSLLDLVAVDNLEIKHSSYRFDIFFNIFSYIFEISIFFCVFFLDGFVIPTLSGIFLSAPWLERECWDMFGIFFVGNKSLRRILTDYGFVGFPLRKDFPVVGFLEMRYDSEETSVVYDNISLDQGIRLWRRLI
jgi:NADH-quinone oxidoreductase subunit C